MIKKIVFTLLSIFLVFQSFELLRNIKDSNLTEFNWLGVFLLSFLLNLFITGVFAFLGFVFWTNKILPESYYQVKNPQRLTQLYKLVKVEYFKYLLLKFFWGKEKNRKKYFDGSKAGLGNFDNQTRQSEFGHLAALITILIVSFYLLILGHVAIFIVTTLINLIGNFYPIVLQRMHRIQIERLKLILERAKAQNLS